ncbi:hypothetical protein HanIR_Chr17g0898781 [Helianthus annuus]|nr:hypothetical protein HanIR_Chr17g0898781 [Helianthus annuus]
MTRIVLDPFHSLIVHFHFRLGIPTARSPNAVKIPKIPLKLRYPNRLTQPGPVHPLILPGPEKLY